MNVLFLYIFSVSAMQKLFKSVKIWQSCSYMYIVLCCFMNHGKNVGFDFSR